MLRREFLKMAGIAPLAMIAPDVFAAPLLQQQKAAMAAGGPYWDRTLVLVELKGGNDGLNTVIPYADEKYYALRPRLAIPKDKVLQLDEKLGLHPSLEALMPLWKSNQLGVTLGVGYPNPNRSHFRSIEIWETGSESNQYLTEGWIACLFEKQSPPASFTADGVVLGGGDIGPLSGPKVRALAMTDPNQFVKQAANVKRAGAAGKNPALNHILDVQEDLEHAVATLRQKVQTAPPLKTTFPGNNFGRQMETTARLLANQVPVAVIKVSIGGFDTHSNQLNTQQRLLKELGDGLAAFQKAMNEAGAWNRVMVMTYSEFGRRAAENGSQGTDHGTAAPHFILGGRVKGGLYGAQPNLNQLDNGDLKFTLDYRSLYSTVSRHWWGLGAQAQPSDFKPLDFLA